jgi:hypothetical protein
MHDTSKKLNAGDLWNHLVAAVLLAIVLLADDVKQRLARPHGEVHLLLQVGHHVECRPVILVDRLDISVGGEDAQSAGQPTQVPTLGAVNVVGRDVYRVQRLVVNPMPPARHPRSCRCLQGS